MSCRARAACSLLALLFLATGCRPLLHTVVESEPFLLEIKGFEVKCDADGRRRQPLPITLHNRGIAAQLAHITVEPTSDEVVLMSSIGEPVEQLLLSERELASGESRKLGPVVTVDTPCEEGSSFDIAVLKWDFQFWPVVPPPAPQQPPPGEGLRVLTYNTAFLSVTIDLPLALPDVVIRPNDEKFSSLSEDDRADKIADAILRGDQDVVALNEVFDADVRARLVTRLAPHYPHYVARLRSPAVQEFPSINALDDVYPGSFLIPDIPGIGDHAVMPGDSGLMLFSRYPFLPLAAQPGAPTNDTQCSASTCQHWGMNNGLPLQPGDFTFTRFDQCDEMDCFASKGVGLVRVDAPPGPTFVAFTHMQADYSPDVYESTRFSQFQQIQATVEGWATPSEIANDQVIVAGDFNVDGKPPPGATLNEWKRLFHPSGGTLPFYACANEPGCQGILGDGLVLTDPWGFETSPADEGTSSIDGGTRLDYVLHSQRNHGICPQHVMIAWDLAENDETWYSDHLPVRLDLNGRGKWCSPNFDSPSAMYRPELVDFPDTDCGDPGNPCDQDESYGSGQGARISHAGQFQWFVIEQPGTYSINMNHDPGEPVDFVVYHESDLSRPISPATDIFHPDFGWKFALLEPPYYIRTFAVDGNGEPDRSASAYDYTIHFHQHLCRDPQDSCFLPAGAIDHPYHWPAKTVYTDVTELYFQFESAGVRNGRLDPAADTFPTVKIEQEALNGSTLSCLEDVSIAEYDLGYSYVQDWAVVDYESVGDADVDNWVDERFVATDLPTTQLDALEVYYAVIHRNTSFECEPSMTTRFNMQTPLTYFKPGRVQGLKMYNDPHWAKDDYIGFATFFDDDVTNPLRTSWCLFMGCLTYEFDDDSDRYLNHVGSLQGYYVDRVAIELQDDDEGRLALATGASDTPDAIDSLFVRFAESSARLTFTDDPDPDDADYLYFVDYVRCREANDCWP